jgi:hypothetical protein
VESGSTTPLLPEDWPRDGRWIAYFRGSRQTGSDTARDRARNVVYDVTPDGTRFVVSIPDGEPSSSRVTVVMNWTSALRP